MKTIPTPRTAGGLLALAALSAILAACGGGDQKAAATPPAATPPAGEAADAAPPPTESPDDKRMANAVATGKTSAPVDLKFDILAKPDVGAPFEIELALLPRLAADTLSVEVTGIPGLTVVSGGALQFDKVLAGDRHVAKVLVQAEQPGIYYVNVVARMITQVQTEARTFSVPVVVGTVAASAKTEPQRDAAGEAIESLPAEESGGSEAPKP